MFPLETEFATHLDDGIANPLSRCARGQGRGGGLFMLPVARLLGGRAVGVGCECRSGRPGVGPGPRIRTPCFPAPEWVSLCCTTQLQTVSGTATSSHLDCCPRAAPRRGLGHGARRAFPSALPSVCEVVSMAALSLREFHAGGDTAWEPLQSAGSFRGGKVTVLSLNASV